MTAEHGEQGHGSAGAGDTGQQASAPRGETAAAWDDVGARFADLGRLIRQRQRQHRAEASEGEPQAPGGTGVGADAGAGGVGADAGAGTAGADSGGTSAGTGSREGGTASAAVRDVVDALDDAFSSLGAAVRDPGFQREARGTLEALGAALGTTLSEMGEHLRDRFDRSDDGGAGDAQAGGPPGDEQRP